MNPTPGLRPLAWALLGIVATILAANRWGVPALVWVAPAPFLVLAARVTGGRGWAWLGLATLIAMTGAIAKIVTPPISPWMMPIFALPMAVGSMVALALWRLSRDRAGPVAALYAWPALTALSDWSGYAHSPLSAWTTSANGLVGDDVLMQVAALGGLGLVGALVAWVPALLATWALRAPGLDLAPHAGLLVAGLVATGLHGAVRLDQGLDTGPTVRVAAVVTDVGIGSGGALPDDATLAANDDALFARSEAAVARGARLIAWNEAASLLHPAGEPALLARGADFARTHGVDLVLAYAVLVSASPLSLRNEYAWFGADGAELQRYAKHHPVPGEPSIRGETPLGALVRPWGTAGGAICFDWDFPSTARGYAALGAGLVVVPSSDWRGIDPLHTEMARVRAIEAGLSVLRPVRDATSAAFDAYGRTRGWMPADDVDGVLVVDLPTRPVPTPYARFGDTPVITCALLVLGGVAAMGWRRRGSPLR